MHVQTHIMSGWCIANLFPLSPRERTLAMIAASAADVDGLGILGGEEMYWRFHHTFGHNLAFTLLVAGVLTVFSSHRVRAFVLYLALGHLHLLLDYFGSGPRWTIPYLWPSSHWVWKYAGAWELYSWQNITAGAVLFAWVIVIAIRQGRTPLEVVMPNLDKNIVTWLQRRRIHAGDDSGRRI